MNNKLFIGIVLIVVILLVGCIGQIEKTGKTGKDFVGNLTNISGASSAQEEKVSPPAPPLPKEENVETQSLVPKAQGTNAQEEWCVPTKINYIAEPYVSINTPKLVYAENTLQTETPSVGTLDYGNSYFTPVIGKVKLLTTIGIPLKHKISELRFEPRLVEADGSIVSGTLFDVKSISPQFNNAINYNLYDDYFVSKDGAVSFEGKLTYSIDGTAQTECVKNKITFLGTDSYTFPVVNLPIVSNADSGYGGAGNSLNTKFNITFDYTGAKPTSAGGYMFAKDPSYRFYTFVDSFNYRDSTYVKYEASNTALVCGKTACTATFLTRIADDAKRSFCSARTVYLVLGVKQGNAVRNILVDLNPQEFLKDFNRCAQ